MPTLESVMPYLQLKQRRREHKDMTRRQVFETLYRGMQDIQQTQMAERKFRFDQLMRSSNLAMRQREFAQQRDQNFRIEQHRRLDQNRKTAMAWNESIKNATNSASKKHFITGFLQWQKGLAPRDRQHVLPYFNLPDSSISPRAMRLYNFRENNKRPPRPDKELYEKDQVMWAQHAIQYGNHMKREQSVASGGVTPYEPMGVFKTPDGNYVVPGKDGALPLIYTPQELDLKNRLKKLGLEGKESEVLTGNGTIWGTETKSYEGNVPVVSKTGFNVFTNKITTKRQIDPAHLDKLGDEQRAQAQKDFDAPSFSSMTPKQREEKDKIVMLWGKKLKELKSLAENDDYADQELAKFVYDIETRLDAPGFFQSPAKVADIQMEIRRRFPNIPDMHIAITPKEKDLNVFDKLDLAVSIPGVRVQSDKYRISIFEGRPIMLGLDPDNKPYVLVYDVKKDVVYSHEGIPFQRGNGHISAVQRYLFDIGLIKKITAPSDPPAMWSPSPDTSAVKVPKEFRQGEIDYFNLLTGGHHYFALPEAARK